MVNPVQPPGTLPQTIPMDTFPGQKMERNQETFRPIVDRKNDLPSAREEISREEVEKTTDKLNRLMGIIDKRWKFSIHEQSHRVMVRIIDQETGETLREIPPKRTLDILSSFTEMAGLYLDKRV